VNRLTTIEAKGWCPGALRPMLSGDGLIVRVRPQSATLGLDELAELAGAAGRFGSGHIDLTRRANLQIRGVSEATLPQLHEVIARFGLLDDNPDGEAVRNVMINPLAGIDPAEVFDVGSIGGELARLLATETSLWALPTKFGFVVDGGGMLGLAEQRGDIRLAAIADEQGPAVAIGLETRVGVEWLGSISPGAAAAVAIETGLAFIAVASREQRQRMRDLSDEGLASVRSAIVPLLDALRENPRHADAPLVKRTGLIELGAGRFAVGIAAPFGRVEAGQIRMLADAMAAHGVKEIRLSPWRTLYAEVSGEAAGKSILAAAASVGLVVDSADALLQIEACPGAPGCQSTLLDTRGDARWLARLLPRFGFKGTVHVSGCAKGCAKSGTSDLVLIGAECGYGLVRNGTPQDVPARHFLFSDLAASPGEIFATDRGSIHD
jgi:precorrin-3B synthase